MPLALDPRVRVVEPADVLAMCITRPSVLWKLHLPNKCLKVEISFCR